MKPLSTSASLALFALVLALPGCGGTQRLHGTRAGNLDAGSIVGARFPLRRGESYMIALDYIKNVGTTPILVESIIAHVVPARRCTITVLYMSGSSHAGGLNPKRPRHGRVSWTWMVGTNTTAGRWPIYVSCGSAGIFQTHFKVR